MSMTHRMALTAYYDCQMAPYYWILKAALPNLFDHKYRWGFSSIKAVPQWLRLGTVYETQAGNAAAELWELPEELRSAVFLGLIFPRNCVLSVI